MTDLIRDYFERRAPDWDSRMPAHLDETLRQLVAAFAAELDAARAILEIGTGTGALIPRLSEHAPTARLVSLDLAHAMLCQAQQRCPGARLVQGDVHALPFSAAARPFDLVVCHNSFPHFADKRRALAEIGRILRPGGQALILHNNSRERVNAIHSQAGGPIAEDFLPPGAEMRVLLIETGYHAVWVEDTADRYLARGVRA
ncbi:MAG: methyltransferase domain-containing protein [Anaerolineae bacterium]|nr:methyltransferase domain-containing protein [Anaerolineae bacterium]